MELSTNQANEEFKEKVLSAKIIAEGRTSRPYYGIEYVDLSGDSHVGYGSYDLKNVLGWYDEYIEVVEDMSLLKERVERLRRIAESHKCYIPSEIYSSLAEAADTIEALSKAADERTEDGWIPASEQMPEEYQYIDEETGYYGRSNEVLCSAYDEYEMRDEMWIDYTIDGEWQTHEYYEEEKLAWQPLPSPYHEP